MLRKTMPVCACASTIFPLRIDVCICNCVLKYMEICLYSRNVRLLRLRGYASFYIDLVLHRKESSITELDDDILYLVQ